MNRGIALGFAVALAASSCSGGSDSAELQALREKVEALEAQATSVAPASTDAPTTASPTTTAAAPTTTASPTTTAVVTTLPDAEPTAAAVADIPDPELLLAFSNALSAIFLSEEWSKGESIRNCIETNAWQLTSAAKRGVIDYGLEEVFNHIFPADSSSLDLILKICGAQEGSTAASTTATPTTTAILDVPSGPDTRPIWTSLPYIAAEESRRAGPDFNWGQREPQGTLDWLPECYDTDVEAFLDLEMSATGLLDAVGDHEILTSGLVLPDDPAEYPTWLGTRPLVLTGNAVPVFTVDDSGGRWDEGWGLPRASGLGVAAARVGAGKIVYAEDGSWLDANDPLSRRLATNVEAWLLDGSDPGTTVTTLRGQLNCETSTDLRQRLVAGERILVTGLWFEPVLYFKEELSWEGEPTGARLSGRVEVPALWGTGINVLSSPITRAMSWQRKIRVATESDVAGANVTRALYHLAQGTLPDDAREIMVSAITMAVDELPIPPDGFDHSFFHGFHGSLSNHFGVAMYSTVVPFEVERYLAVERPGISLLGGQAMLQYESQLATSCDPYANWDYFAGSARSLGLEKGETLFDPQIVFSDEASNLFFRSPDQVGGSFTIDKNQIGAVTVRDDGTVGDLVAEDGIYTAACVTSAVTPGPTSGAWPAGLGDVENLHVLDASLRGSVPIIRVANDASMTDAGFFFDLGEIATYIPPGGGVFWANHCMPCMRARDLAGDAFDFMVLATRTWPFGGGYQRISDGVVGVGHPQALHTKIPQYPEPGRLQGLIEPGGHSFGALTHEIGHWMGWGIDFPEAGAEWNSGDGMHLEWDNTTQGDLKGPVWDPVRGYPYSVRLLDKAGKPVDSYVAGSPTEGFRLEQFDDEPLVWDDIFLYMLGLLDPADTGQQYWKVLDVGLPDICEPWEMNVLCPVTELPITVGRSVQYSVETFIDRYGPRIPSYEDAPKTFDIGFLFTSDREFTEAETTWLTLAVREYTTREDWTRSTAGIIKSVPWPTATRGLGAIWTDWRDVVAQNLGD